MSHSSDPNPRRFRDVLAEIRRWLDPRTPRLRPAAVTVQASWLLLREGRPALTGRSSRR
jgi:hypothetical protein